MGTSPGLRAAFESVDVAAGQLDVLPSELDRPQDPRPLAELVPGLDRPDLPPRAQRLLELSLVVGAVLARRVDPALAAELRVLEARPDLGDGEAGVFVEARRRRSPAVEALGPDELVAAG